MITLDGKAVTTWQIVSAAPCFITRQEYDALPFGARLSFILLAAVWLRQNGFVLKITEE